MITNCRPLSIVEEYLSKYNLRYDAKRLGTNHFVPKLEREIVYGSQNMKDLISKIDLIAGSHCPVIIYGETGTGKGMMAQYIHEKSNRREHKLVEINCSALPENLIESELFGYEKGAFTGASANGKIGLFELAHDGTIFLDEIGEMPLHLQAKLLKVLDAGYVLRLGGTVYHKVNTRIVVATNKNLKELVKEGRFREDLFYRLNVLPITMPPLRDRKEDIYLLSQKIMDELNHKYDRKKFLTHDTITQLEAYHWPGNVRQLRNMIERMYVLQTGEAIEMEPVDIFLQDEEIYPLSHPCAESDVNQGSASGLNDEVTLKEYAHHAEKEYINRILSNCNGSISEAAKVLGIHRTSLYKKMHESFMCNEEKG